jgi:hypothetical protein|nr:MAG TPA: hypothetical protein [Caudoviricetes sp.]
MTKLERQLIKVALREAYGPDWGVSAYYFNDLDECYKKYSSDKYRADMYNREVFKKEVIEVLNKHTNKIVYSNHYILSYNRIFFTTLQIAYFFSDDGETYLGLRYDTAAKTIKKYIEINKYDLSIIILYNSIDDMFYGKILGQNSKGKVVGIKNIL